MSPIASSPATHRRRSWTLLGCLAVVVTGLGIVALGRWPGVAVWIVLGGAVAAHWAGRRASDCSVLSRLEGMPLADVAGPVARVRPRSVTPVADIARIRAAGCGIVTVDGVDRVLPASHVDRYEVDVLLTGAWDQLAGPATVLDADVTADRLARLPDEGEVWLVHTAIATLAVDGARLRTAAATGRRLAGARTTNAGVAGRGGRHGAPHRSRRTVGAGR